MKIYSPFVIVSAELSHLSAEENDQRSEALEAMLEAKHLSYKPVLGCYKGKRENSFLVLAAGRYVFSEVMSLARAYGQESILYVDSDRAATLYFLDDRAPVGLGLYREVSEQAALQQDAYTYDPQTAGYWVAMYDA